jgi:hypothetical protein
MLLLRTERLPEGPDWLYELKLDGYRASGKSAGRVQLRSRNDKDFNARYPTLVEALGSMPDDTVLDGEVVALDEEGRPSFNALQHHGAQMPVYFFIFDLLILRGREVMAEPLVKRCSLIEKHVLPALADPIRYSPILEASLANLIRSVKEQGLRAGGETPGQPVRAWRAVGSLGHDARQSRVGFRDRWLHCRRPGLRRADLRLLGRRPADVCRADAARVPLQPSGAVAPALPGPGDARVSVRESPGSAAGAMG